MRAALLTVRALRNIDRPYRHAKYRQAIGSIRKSNRLRIFMRISFYTDTSDSFLSIRKQKGKRRPRPQRQRVHLAVTACCVVREVRGRAGLSPPPRPFPCRVRDNAVTAVTPVPGHVDRSQHALVVAAACRTRERAPHLRLVRREGCDGGADGGGGKGGCDGGDGVEGGPKGASSGPGPGPGPFSPSASVSTNAMSSSRSRGRRTRMRAGFWIRGSVCLHPEFLRERLRA